MKRLSLVLVLTFSFAIGQMFSGPNNDRAMDQMRHQNTTPSEPTFTISIKNDTGYLPFKNPIVDIRISLSTDENWGSNLLSGELSPGSTISYEGLINSWYDIRLTDNKGNIYVKTRYQMTHNVTIVFTDNDKR